MTACACESCTFAALGPQRPAAAALPLDAEPLTVHIARAPHGDIPVSVSTEPQEPQRSAALYPKAPSGTMLLHDGQVWRKGDAQWVPIPAAPVAQAAEQRYVSILRDQTGNEIDRRFVPPLRVAQDTTGAPLEEVDRDLVATLRDVVEEYGAPAVKRVVDLISAAPVAQEPPTPCGHYLTQSNDLNVWCKDCGVHLDQAQPESAQGLGLDRDAIIAHVAAVAGIDVASGSAQEPSAPSKVDNCATAGAPCGACWLCASQEPPAPSNWTRCICGHDADRHGPKNGCVECQCAAPLPAPGSAQEPADPPRGQPYLVDLGSALVACQLCGAAVGTGHTVTHDAWHRGQS